MNEISGISEDSNMLCSMTVTGKHDWNQILPATGQNLRAVGMCIAPISVRRQGSFVDLKENTVFTGSLYNCVVKMCIRDRYSFLRCFDVTREQ